MIDLKPYEQGVPLQGMDAPPLNDVEDWIRYLMTIRHRFGNTIVKGRVNWGAAGLWVESWSLRAIELLQKKEKYVEPDCCDPREAGLDYWHETKEGKELEDILKKLNPAT